MRGQSLYEWCQENGEYGQRLLQEWTGEDEQGNTVDTYSISRGSSKKLKWKCSEAHEWYATIYNRTANKSCCPICARSIRAEHVRQTQLKNGQSLYDWCQENGEFGQHLLDEWTGELESGEYISMYQILYASGKKTKWRCNRGHEWYAKINNRTSSRQNCPYCSGNKVSNKNSLSTWCQNNAAFGQQLQQEYTGQTEFGEYTSIDEIAYGSHTKLKWRCNQGHEWFSTVLARTSQKQGCPICYSNIRGELLRQAQLKNSQSLYEWCKNNGNFGQQLQQEYTGITDSGEHLSIDQVSYGSRKKLKWKCSNGHEWYAIVVARTNQKQYCPYCSGKIVSDKNSLAAWCQNNGNFGQQLQQEYTGIADSGEHIPIDQISYGSVKKLKWKCNNWHEWFATTASRTYMKSGCPYCSGNRVSELNSLDTWCQNNGVFGQQLQQEYTGITDSGEHIQIDQISYGSHKRLKWRCSKKHEWFAIVKDRTVQKQCCPYCSKRGTSYPEQFLFRAISQIFPKTLNRSKIDDYEFDIYIPEKKNAIEYGASRWHSDKVNTRDQEKAEICKRHGITFIRIYANSTYSSEPCEELWDTDLIIYNSETGQKDNHNLIKILNHILTSLGHSLQDVDYQKAFDEAWSFMHNLELSPDSDSDSIADEFDNEYF